MKHETDCFNQLEKYVAYAFDHEKEFLEEFFPVHDKGTLELNQFYMANITCYVGLCDWNSNSNPNFSTTISTTDFVNWYNDQQEPFFSNTETLFIRACKSLEPHKRVTSVYRRFYLSGSMEAEAQAVVLSSILMSIVEKLGIMTPGNMAYALSTEQAWMYEGCTYYQRLLRIVVSHIRLTGRDCLPDNYRMPARFRNSF